MQDYLHEIKDADDLRNHLINTKNYKFTWNLPDDEASIWNQVNKNHEFFRGMIKQGSEFMAQLGISSYKDYLKM